MSGYAIPPTPNRGAPYLTAPTARTVEEGREAGPPGFRRISTLAALPGPGVGCNRLLATVGCSGLDSQLLGTILGPFPIFGPGPLFEYLTHFEILEMQFSTTRHGTMPIGTTPRFWTWGWHRFEKLPYGCRDMAISMCLALSIFLRHRESLVETEQMSAGSCRVFC